MSNVSLSWSEIKAKVYEAYQPIELLSEKLRVEIDFQDGFFDTEKLVNKMQLFLTKMESCEKESLFSMDVEILKTVQQQLKLFTDSANDLKEDERKVLYYLLIKKESECDIAKHRMPASCSASKINRLKKCIFLKLLDNVEYNELKQLD